MSELRRDYFLDHWVLVSSKRGARPRELSKPNVSESVSESVSEGVCYFCPGSESLTPSEIGRISDNGSGKVGWFENSFPV